MENNHILYSFRRCPFAIRGRMALYTAGINPEVREIIFRNKPVHMLEISPKGTVPVLQLQDGTVIDESLDVMLWALEQSDPKNWLRDKDDALTLIAENDGPFKNALDRYKYPDRYEDQKDTDWRAQGEQFLTKLEERLNKNGGFLQADEPTIADYAIFPFIRQFRMPDKHWFDEEMPYPKLRQWLFDFMESDTFKAIMPKLKPWEAGQGAVYLTNKP